MKVAVIGSCASEDWIHYGSLDSAFDIEVPPLRQHSSLISLFARPCAVPAELGGRLNEWESRQIRSDLDKSFLQRLVSERPAAVLVDLAIDSVGGVAQFQGSLITYSYFMQRSALAAGLDPMAIFLPARAPAAYAAALVTAARRFDAFMKRELPECRVILHKCRFATAYLDKARTVRPFPENEREHFTAANNFLGLLEATAETAIACTVIDVREDPLLADETHLWGLGAMHLERRYYARFQAAFERIMSG